MHCLFCPIRAKFNWASISYQNVATRHFAISNILHFSFFIFHSYLIPHTLYLVPHTSHLIPHTPHLTPHTPFHFPSLISFPTFPSAPQLMATVRVLFSFLLHP